MAKTFSEAEWRNIYDHIQEHGYKYGLPRRRNKSLVLGSFNIRKLGAVNARSETAWNLLAMICRHFDLLAIQEVMDNLDGIRHLRDLVNGRNTNSPAYGLVVSDTTGVYPSEGTTAERLAFLFRWRRVSRTEIASDITYDRTKVCNTLFTHREEFNKAFDNHQKALDVKKKPAPAIPNPQFVTFIRQPLCVSFQTGNDNDEKPYRFLAVNCHLLFGRDPEERKREFEALIGWLVDRARNPKYMYYPNIILMGDCNLDLDNPKADMPEIDRFLKSLNKGELEKKGSAEINFPFLDTHPIHKKILTTNIRNNQTFDQIAIVFHDSWLPDYQQNKNAGATPNGYDYGVFNFMDAISDALYGCPFAKLTGSRRKELAGKSEYSISDHLPIWIRLPIFD